jgi:hypothetical protein
MERLRSNISDNLVFQPALASHPGAPARIETDSGTVSMEPQKSAEEICEIVAGVMRDFREGMDSSHQLGLRIGRRTTQIIRMGLFSVLALAAAMF